MSGKGSVLLYYEDGKTADYELHSIAYELEPNGVAIATFSDEKTLNALTLNFLAEIFVIIEHAKRDPAVKVLIWTGRGKAWCSGAALKGEQKVYVPADAIKEYKARAMMPGDKDIACKNLTLAFWDFPKPSIAAVQGLCVGGGTNMALCNFHDLVYCSEEARFKLPFAQLGITPEMSSSKTLPFLIGFAKAKALLMLGSWLPAREAERFGLVTAVVEAGQLMPEALGAARRLAAERHQEALHLSKSLVNSHHRRELAGVLDEENRVIWEAIEKLKENGDLFRNFAKL
mmetsp:Transcript_47876/g.104157  ORF Transcript_47876/g.104157 Transcript_47876/m.104157 type:complete len:287 (+) Transcript_47876:73-933(+)